VTLKQQVAWPKQWKVTSYTVFGILFSVLGIAALIAPNFSYVVNKQEQITDKRRILTETRRVISIPRPASIAEIVLGLGLVYFGSRKLR
jgi:hypothetical protein